MSEEQNEHLTDLAESVESALSELQWVKRGAKDERDVKKVMRSRKKLDAAIEAYAQFSDAIEGLDFDDEENNIWFEKWRELKSEISEIQVRMESTVSVVATHDDEDAFNSDDEEKPGAEGIAASLQMADDIKATMDKDIERLADILRVSEELKDLADHCLDELQSQRERLMAINAKLKAIDKSVEKAEGILEKIKINMAANKCCWAIGCTIIWICVAAVIAVGVSCGVGLCNGAPPAPSSDPVTTTTAPGRMLFLRGGVYDTDTQIHMGMDMHMRHNFYDLQDN